MAELNRMAAQLTAALDRVEKMAQPLAEAGARADKADAEIRRLKDEREVLLARIALLEDEARELGGVTDRIEGRLDSAISEIRTALAR